LTCKLLRILPNSENERKYWLEKFNLFSFKAVAKCIEVGCVPEIREKINKLPASDKKEMEKLKYWTKIERLVLKSWRDCELIKEE